MISIFLIENVVKIKIIHVIVALNVGGAELMLKRLIESQLNKGKFIHEVISLSETGLIGVELQLLGVRVRCLKMKSAFDIPRVLWQLRAIFIEQRPHIVQTWMYHADLLGGLSARMAGIEDIIWGIRTTDVGNAFIGATAWVRRICAFLSSSVPKYIVCAANASLKSHAAIGYDSTRMLSISNGFELARFVPLSQQRVNLRVHCGIEPDSVVVGYLGRFHSDKDQANFVRAAGMVAFTHPNVVFLMVGRELDAANADIQSWIRESGHSGRFVLLGERSDVPECLSAMDLFCLSSRTEGFPNVVGEAMAMGLPCVVTDVGDAAMLVADTGVVVPKEDSIALAHGLGKLLGMSVAERSQLGQKAKARIHSEFSMMRASERFASLYDQMTNKGSC